MNARMNCPHFIYALVFFKQQKKTTTDLRIPASPVRCAVSLDQVPPDNTAIEETDYKLHALI